MPQKYKKWEVYRSANKTKRRRDCRNAKKAKNAEKTINPKTTEKHQACKKKTEIQRMQKEHRKY